MPPTDKGKIGRLKNHWTNNLNLLYEDSVLNGSGYNPWLRQENRNRFPCVFGWLLWSLRDLPLSI